MSETEMSKVNKTVVMRVTPDEAAKLRYQRKFDKAWAREQAREKEQVQAEAYVASVIADIQATAASMGGTLATVQWFRKGAEAAPTEVQGQAYHSIILDDLSEVAQ